MCYLLPVLTTQVHESRASKVNEEKIRPVFNTPELVVNAGGEGPIAEGIRGPRPLVRAVRVDRPEKPGKAGMDEGLVRAGEMEGVCM